MGARAWLGAVVVFGVAVGCDARKPDATPAAEEKAAPMPARPGPKGPVVKDDPTEPPIAVTVEAAAKEFAADAAAARARYGGRVVVLEGRLSDLGRDKEQGDVRAVLVGISDPVGRYKGTPMNCAFRAADEKKVMALSWDQPIKVRGRCRGEPWISNLNMVDCALESAGPDPSIRVTVAELGADVAALMRSPAGLAKYEGKPLTLTDAVVTLRGESELVLAAKPGEERGFQVYARRTFLNRADDALFDAVKVGDRITIRCRFDGTSVNNVSVSDCRIAP